MNFFFKLLNIAKLEDLLWREERSYHQLPDGNGTGKD